MTGRTAPSAGGSATAPAASPGSCDLLKLKQRSEARHRGWSDGTSRPGGGSRHTAMRRQTAAPLSAAPPFPRDAKACDAAGLAAELDEVRTCGSIARRLLRRPRNARFVAPAARTSAARPEREPARSLSGRPHPSGSGSGVPLGGSGETAGETESGRAMDTRTIAVVALVVAVVIVVILFVL
jgi:hypothetical protein